MPANFSASSSAIWAGTVDWPLERIELDVEIVEPRPLTALEWAVLAVLEAFRDVSSRPTLDEAASELGLGDRVFLEDALDTVQRLGAVQPTAGDGTARELAEVAFTASGLELFRRGRIEGQPAKHRLVVHFDALTGELVARPPLTGRLPRWPITSAGALAPPRTAIGLDHARDIARQLRPDLLKGEAYVRKAEVVAHDIRFLQPPTHEWRVVSVEATVEAGGAIRLEAAGLTTRAREALADCDVLARRGLPRDAEPLMDGLPGWAAVPWDRWRPSISRVVALGRLPSVVAELIASAQIEVATDRAWLDVEGVTDALNTAVERGVRVLVLGDRQDVVRWNDRETERRVGFRAHFPARQRIPALAVDRRSALRGERVQLSWQGAPLESVLVGGLDGAAAAALHDALVASIVADDTPPRVTWYFSPEVAESIDTAERVWRELLATEEARVAIVVAAYRDVPTPLASITHAIETFPVVSARLAAYARIGAVVARATSPVCRRWWDDHWAREWARAWTSSGRHSVSPAVAEALARYAPDNVSAADFHARVLAAHAPEGEALAMWHLAICARWGEDALKRILTPPASPRSSPTPPPSSKKKGGHHKKRRRK